MAPLIAITARDISAAGTAVDAELPAAWLDRVLNDDAGPLAAAQGPIRCADGAGRLTGRLSRSGRDVVVRGRVMVALELRCVRCLGRTQVSVDADLSLLLQPARRSELLQPRDKDEGELGYEFGAEEAALDVYDGETVVLDDFVREAILLEVPSFPLCSEACAGMAPAASEELGSAEPVDPRLAPLRAVRAMLGGAAQPDPADPAEPTRKPQPKPMLRSSSRRGLRKHKSPRNK